jgi:hypothetical protein
VKARVPQVLEWNSATTVRFFPAECRIDLSFAALLSRPAGEGFGNKRPIVRTALSRTCQKLLIFRWTPFQLTWRRGSVSHQWPGFQ